jgi:hypothetical protein
MASFAVIPANAGIHFDSVLAVVLAAGSNGKMDPSVRQDDEFKHRGYLTAKRRIG